MCKLRIARAIRAIGQHRLAKLVGVSQATVSLWENEFRMPTEQQKQKVATVLNFPIEQLWLEDEESSKKEKVGRD